MPTNEEFKKMIAELQAEHIALEQQLQKSKDYNPFQAGYETAMNNIINRLLYI